MKERILKRFTSIFLALVMIVSTAPVSFGAASDIDDHWAETPLKSFIAAGLLNGDGTGNYKPDSPMTRAQFAAILNRMTGQTAESPAIAEYKDVSPSDWYYSDLAKALAAGYMTGTSADTLSPNAAVTREQGFVMLARYLKLNAGDASALDPFRDAASIASYARDGMAAMVAVGLVQGSDGRIWPKAALTRAEGIAVLDRAKASLQAIAGTGIPADDPVPGSPAPGVSPGAGSSGGGSGGSGGGSGNSGSNPGGNTQNPAAVNLVKAEQTKLVDLGWSQYVSISFADGYNRENCEVWIDGVEVTSGVTNVTDSGSLAKWELTSLNPSKLTVISKTDASKAQTITLSGNEAPASPAAISGGTAPAYILTHGTVPVWDYHLTNYDENGSVRVTPSKTTFDLNGTASAAIKSYSADAELKKDNSIPYGVSGDVRILFNYGTNQEKAWFDNIAETGALALVSYNENLSTLNPSLNYIKDTALHSGRTVGVLTVPVGQSNFFSNGRYNIRVTSQGGRTALVPIHVVNEEAPSMRIKEADSIVSGQNVHFTVSNMTYGITVPIETVILTDPAGEDRTLEKIVDWYLFGDLFVLYNDLEGHNNIPVNGVYKLTISSNGFKTMEKSFEVSGGDTGILRFKTAELGQVDVMSSATGSGGSSGGSGGGPGMSADLLFNADLLINAMILDKLGIENSAAKGIVERWKYDLSGHDAVYSEDGVLFYTWVGYNDAVREAKLKGSYLSFAEYAASGKGETTLNRPYAVKEVLEDNLLGETQYNGSYKGKTPPVLRLSGGASSVAEGSDTVLICGEELYLNAISELYINKHWQKLDPAKYAIDKAEKTITISASAFKLGENSLAIKAEGYKESVTKIIYEKTLEAHELTLNKEVYSIGESVEVEASGSTGDYFKFFTSNNSVRLVRPDKTEKNVLPDGQESLWDKIGYTLSGRTLTLGKDLFKEAGEYQLILTPQQYYEPQTLRFSVAAEPEGPELMDVPDFVKMEKLSVELGADVKVVVSNYYDRSYSDALTGALIDGVKKQRAELEMDFFGEKFTIKNLTMGEHTIVLHADGYKDKTLTVTVIGKSVPSYVMLTYNGSTVTGTNLTLAAAEDVRIAVSSPWLTSKEYKEGLTEVTVNDTAADLSFVAESGYDAVHIAASYLQTGNNTIVLKAAGYQDKTFTVTVGQ